MPKRKTTVLIADDGLQLLDLVTLNLELEGYGVLRASDGRRLNSLSGITPTWCCSM